MGGADSPDRALESQAAHTCKHTLESERGREGAVGPQSVVSDRDAVRPQECASAPFRLPRSSFDGEKGLTQTWPTARSQYRACTGRRQLTIRRGRSESQELLPHSPHVQCPPRRVPHTRSRSDVHANEENGIAPPNRGGSGLASGVGRGREGRRGIGRLGLELEIVGRHGGQRLCSYEVTAVAGVGGR